MKNPIPYELTPAMCNFILEQMENDMTNVNDAQTNNQAIVLNQAEDVDVTVIDLTSAANKMFAYYVDDNPETGSGFGINDEYFKVGVSQMQDYAQQHDCENDGTKHWGTNASRLAKNMMISKDRQRMYALERLGETLRKNVANPIEGTTEIPQQQRKRREQYERDMEEQVAIAHSDFLGAESVYNTVFEKFISKADRDAGDLRAEQQYTAVSSDRLARLQAVIAAA